MTHFILKSTGKETSIVATRNEKVEAIEVFQTLTQNMTQINGYRLLGTKEMKVEFPLLLKIHLKTAGRK